MHPARAVRDLRNRSADELRRVERGEKLTITRDGDPVAAVVPLPRRAVRVEGLIARRKLLPPLDVVQLRDDLDEILDSTL